MKNSLGVLLRTTALAGSICGFGFSLPANAQSMTDLGTRGGLHSPAYGVSADGSVSVGKSDITGVGQRAFKYSGVTMTNLGSLGSGLTSEAFGVSADGSVIVGYSYITGGLVLVAHATTWATASGAITDLGTLGGAYSAAYGASNDGSVIVGYSEISGASGARHATKWVGGTPTDLGTLLGGYNSFATGVSGLGSVVVGYADNSIGNYLAFVHDGTTMTSLGTLGGTNSWANGVSANGSVIVGYSDITGGGQRAFRYSGGVMSDLGTLLGGTYSYAFGVSADGSVIVGESGTAVLGETHAFAWRGGKMIDLPETSADLARSANNIRNTIALRTSSMALMMDYDCRAFGQHNTCISFGGRYGDLNASANEGAGILTLAYRLSPSVRIGAFIDHRVTQSKPAGINYSDDTPSVGAFVAYDDRGNGTGAQGKLTAVYNTGKVGVTRLASSANTEAGSGRSSLTSYAVGA